jgi:hypothetical protein
MKKGRAGTMTHDYKRNGTTTLFAALETWKARSPAAACHATRHQEFISFLDAIDARVPIFFCSSSASKVPAEASLRETRKFQNVRAGGTMIEKVRRIQDAGMEVMAGMILGFDNDDETVFDAHRKFIDSARISVAGIGMLSAIPSTPLYARPAAEQRLDLANQPAHGTNVVPLRMTRETLSEGFSQLMTSLYEPQAFSSASTICISLERWRPTALGGATPQGIYGCDMRTI